MPAHKCHADSGKNGNETENTESDLDSASDSVSSVSFCFFPLFLLRWSGIASRDRWQNRIEHRLFIRWLPTLGLCRPSRR